MKVNKSKFCLFTSALVFLSLMSSCNLKDDFTNPLDSENELPVPYELNVNMISETFVTLEWKVDIDPHSDEVANKVWTMVILKTSDDKYVVLDTLKKFTKSATLYHKFNGPGNTFRLRIIAGSKSSGFSAPSRLLGYSFAPRFLSANLNSNTIQLRWQNHSNNEACFYLERKIGESGNYSLLSRLNPGMTWYDDSETAAKNNRYYYRLCAVFKGFVYSPYDTVSVFVP